MAVTGTVDGQARRDALRQRLAREGSLDLGESAREWEVHPMTIRRDFDAMVRAGLARRVRGGVVAVSADAFSQREHHNAAAKSRIADKLAQLVPKDAALALDASTTISALAPRLVDRSGSVITNGLSAFGVLSGREKLRAYLTGGEREEQNHSLVGSLAVGAIGQFSLDLALVSTMSLDADFGSSEMSPEQVAVKVAMADAAERVVLAVDSSKLASRARFRSLPLTRYDVLVTELDPDDERLDPYRSGVADIR